jgi:hypothetical protein
LTPLRIRWTIPLNVIFNKIIKNYFLHLIDTLPLFPLKMASTTKIEQSAFSVWETFGQPQIPSSAAAVRDSTMRGKWYS